MDGCSCHRSAYLDRLFDENGIVVVPLQAHSSDQVQALDLGIFGNHKSAQARIHLPTEMSKQTQQVIRAVSAFQTIAHPYAITSAFTKAGITPVFREGRCFVAITPWTATRVRNLPDEYSQAPRDFRPFDKTRVEIANLDFQAGRHEHDEGVYGYIEDLPCVPDSLDPTYESTSSELHCVCGLPVSVSNLMVWDAFSVHDLRNDHDVKICVLTSWLLGKGAGRTLASV